MTILVIEIATPIKIDIDGVNMTKSKKILRLLPCIALLGLSTVACKTRITDFTVISTKNVDLSQMGTFKRGPNRIEGEDLKMIIIFIPTGTPNLKAAIDDGISKVPGAVALVDGVVYSYQMYAILFAKFGYIVEGTPLIDPKQVGKASAIPARPSSYMVSVPSSENKGNAIAYLSKADYELVRTELRANNVDGAIEFINKHKLN